MKKIKILIAGIGGVGGYFGGLLAKHFFYSEEIEIIFLARGEHLKAIKKNGLKVIKGNTEFIARPTLATDNPTEIGLIDYLILCTKSYDLETTLTQIKNCINSDTVILPLLNGVDSRERIKNIFPDNLVSEGCVYIISRLTAAGRIENKGNTEILYFGLENFENKKLVTLEKIFKQAGIKAVLTNNILSRIWEKYILIAATATSTSYFETSMGVILADDEKHKILIQLIEEVKNIALAKNINIPADISAITLNKLKSIPYEATSSMHDDFKKSNQKTELQSITGYVVKEGLKNNIPTPTFQKLLSELEKKDR